MPPVKVALPFSTTGKQRGTANRGNERQPIRKAGSGDREANCRCGRQRARGLNVDGGSGQSELWQVQRVAGNIVDAVGMRADSQVPGDMVLGRSEIEGELDFSIAGSSLPASFERAGDRCCGMVG